MASPRNSTANQKQTATRLQVQTLDPSAAVAEGDNRAAAAAGSDLPPQSPHPPKSPRTKPYRARGSRGRGGRRRRAAQKQAEAEAAAAALLVSPASSAATAGESPRSMTSMAGEDAYSDADADAVSSYLSSPGPSPLPSPRQYKYNYQTHEYEGTAAQKREPPQQPSSAPTPTPTPPLSPFHQQLEGLSHAASQAADAAQAAAVTSAEIFDPPRIQRKMDAMAASAARTASTWSSTIDRPMETIEILTDRLCPVRQDATSDDAYNATSNIDATAFPPPGLQRLRTFSSELSVSSTFDSPRGRAGTDVSYQSTESNYLPPAPPAAANTNTTMPQIAEDLDLEGLALIEEDKDLNLVRTDTHITSMSTASTNFGGANSSQMTQHHSVTSTATVNTASVVSSSPPRGYVRPLVSLEDQHLFGGGGSGGMGSAVPSPRSRTSSCEYSEYSTASTQAILDGHPGVLPPPMSTSHHAKTDRPQYESRFLAGGGYGGLAGAEGGRFWDDEEHGDVYSFSDESSMQSNGYFFRESGATPRSMGLPPPPSASKASGGHSAAAGRGRTFTDPTHTAMGFNQPAPIPFAVEQVEHAKAAALREHQIQSQGHHLGSTAATPTTTTTIHRNSHAVETKHQAHPSVVGNRGRTFSEPTAEGRGGGTKTDEIDSTISQDDSASLFNISPKSFLLGQQSGGGGGGGDGDSGTQKPRFDYEGK